MDTQRSTTLDLAINNFQSIFPSLPLPSFSYEKGSFMNSLQNLTNSIPVPSEADLQRTLSSMRAIMDEQEFRYQNSLLPEPVEEMMLFDEECNYEQCSTGLLQRKATCSVGEENEKISFVEDIWNWKSEKSNENVLEDYYYFID